MVFFWGKKNDLIQNSSSVWAQPLPNRCSHSSVNSCSQPCGKINDLPVGGHRWGLLSSLLCGWQKTTERVQISADSHWEKTFLTDTIAPDGLDSCRAAAEWCKHQVLNLVQQIERFERGRVSKLEAQNISPQLHGYLFAFYWDKLKFSPSKHRKRSFSVRLNEAFHVHLLAWFFQLHNLRVLAASWCRAATRPCCAWAY